jgi:response regulator RpfG family c-di-GMP phosphodiesterase
VIDECALFSYGPIERSPAVACYAGLMAAKSGAKNPGEVMIAALMSDLGLLNVSPRIITALRNSSVEGLPEDDLKVYQNHPVESLNQLLARKMPVPESVKNMILCSHERFDQKGFPHQLMTEKIPNESYLIQICQLLDQQSLVKMGEKRLGFAAVKAKFFEVESVSESRFPLTLLMQVQRML